MTPRPIAVRPESARAARWPRRLAWCLALAVTFVATARAQDARRWDVDVLRETFGLTPESPLDADWDDLRQACPRRDCIPSIDDPEFVPASAVTFLEDDDLVLGFVGRSAARAYPVAVLDRHEIVNDTIDGVPVAVTWCPLCGSGLAFRRELDGRAVEFGVSGVLRDNDLILYDRATESLWQQITGRAIAGPRRGERLETLPVAVARWASWRAAHPDSQVLVSRDPRGEIARLDRPYGDYDETTRLLFEVRHPSDLAHPKTVVYGVEVGDASVAVTERALTGPEPLVVEIGGVDVALRRQPDGLVRATRVEDGHELPAHRMFWFAWATYHPGTALRDAPGADRSGP